MNSLRLPPDKRGTTKTCSTLLQRLTLMHSLHLGSLRLSYGVLRVTDIKLAY